MSSTLGRLESLRRQFYSDAWGPLGASPEASYMQINGVLSVQLEQETVPFRWNLCLPRRKLQSTRMVTWSQTQASTSRSLKEKKKIKTQTVQIQMTLGGILGNLLPSNS